MKRTLAISPSGEFRGVFANNQLSRFKCSGTYDHYIDRIPENMPGTVAKLTDFCIGEEFTNCLESGHFTNDFITFRQRSNIKTKENKYYSKTFTYDLKEKLVCTFLLKNGEQICIMTASGFKILAYKDKPKTDTDVDCENYLDYVVVDDISYSDLKSKDFNDTDLNSFQYNQNRHRIFFSDNGEHFCIKDTVSDKIYLFDVGNNECVNEWTVSKNTSHKISNRRNSIYFGSRGIDIRAENEFMSSCFFKRSEADVSKNSPIRITESPDGSVVALSWINLSSQRIETAIFETLSYTQISSVISRPGYSDWDGFRISFIKEAGVYSAFGILNPYTLVEKHKFVDTSSVPSRSVKSMLNDFLEDNRPSAIAEQMYSLTALEKILLSQATTDLHKNKSNKLDYLNILSQAAKEKILYEVFDLNISKLHDWAEHDEDNDITTIKAAFAEALLYLIKENKDVTSKSIYAKINEDFSFIKTYADENVFSNMDEQIDLAQKSIAVKNENIKYYKSLTTSEKTGVRKIVAKKLFNEIKELDKTTGIKIHIPEKDLYNALRKWDGSDILNYLETEKDYMINNVEEISKYNNAHKQIKSAHEEYKMTLNSNNKTAPLGPTFSQTTGTMNMNGAVTMGLGTTNMISGTLASGTTAISPGAVVLNPYVYYDPTTGIYSQQTTSTYVGSYIPVAKGSVSDLIPDPYQDPDNVIVLNQIFHTMKNLDNVYSVVSTKDKKYIVVAGKKKVNDANDLHSKLPYDLRKRNYDLSAIHKISVFKKAGTTYNHVVDLHHHNFLYDKTAEKYDDTTQLMGCNLNIGSTQDSEDLTIEAVYRTHNTESKSVISNIHLPNTSQLIDTVEKSGVFKDSLWLETAVQMLSPKTYESEALNKLTKEFQEVLVKNPSITDHQSVFQGICNRYDISTKEQVVFGKHLNFLGYKVENLPAEKTTQRIVSITGSFTPPGMVMGATGKVVTVPFLVAKAANEFIEHFESEKDETKAASFFKSLCKKYRFTQSEETQLEQYLEELVDGFKKSEPTEVDVILEELVAGFKKSEPTEVDVIKPSKEEIENLISMKIERGMLPTNPDIIMSERETLQQLTRSGFDSVKNMTLLLPVIKNSVPETLTEVTTKPELSMFQQAMVKSFVDVVSDQFLDIIKNYYPNYQELFEIPYFVGVLKLAIGPLIESLGIKKINENEFVQEAFHVLKKEGLTEISLDAIDYVEKQFRALISSQKIPVLNHVFKNQETTIGL